MDLLSLNYVINELCYELMNYELSFYRERSNKRLSVCTTIRLNQHNET